MHLTGNLKLKVKSSFQLLLSPVSPGQVFPTLLQQMSSNKEKLKLWFLIATNTETQPEAVTEAVTRAMEGLARRAHRYAQNHSQAHVTPFQL